MALFTVDQNNIMGKTVAEAGSYNVLVLNTSELSTSNNSGNQMLVLNYEVADGKYKGGQIRYHYLVWNPDYLDSTVRRFNTLAVAAGAQNGQTVNSLEDLLHGCIGKVINVTVDWEKNDNKGEYFLRVKSFGPRKAQSEPNGITRPKGDENYQNNSKATAPNFDQPSNGFNSQSQNGFGNQSANDYTNIDPNDLPFD